MGGNITVTANNICGSSTAQTVASTTIDTSVTIAGIIIMANVSDASYQWINCNDGNKPILGQTYQGFNVPGNGNYAVIVSKDCCNGTSFCFAMLITEIVEYNSSRELTIYPNPSNGKFYYSITESQFKNNFTLEIYNIQGKKIYESRISNQEDSFDLSNQSKGVYYLKLFNDKLSFKKRIIVY